MSKGAILELDVGNTRTKWRLMSVMGEKLSSGVCSGPGLEGLLEKDVSVSRVRVSSVRSKPLEEQLAREIEKVFGVSAQFARSVRTCAGVTNSYKDASALGVDRWLAILAAYNSTRECCLVVDAGSAITLDVVDAKGLHLGGYIVPGLTIQANALLSGTQIIRPQDLVFGELGLGDSTRSAITNGILSMVVACISETRAGLKDSPKIYLTGGDADAISSALKERGVSHECFPELVLDGLGLALNAESG